MEVVCALIEVLSILDNWKQKLRHHVQPILTARVRFFFLGGKIKN